MSGLEDLSDAELMKRYELSQKPAGKNAEPVGAGEDFLRSAAIGPVKGAIGLAGLPGDYNSLVGAGTAWAARKLGMDPKAIDLFEQFYGNSLKRDASAPTSGQVRSGVESLTGPLYEPSTTAGKVTQTVTEGVPSALAGPGGWMRNLFNYAVAPGLASEGASRLPGVQGTAAEPWVKGGTALATGGVAGLVNRPSGAAAVVGNATRGVTGAQAAQAEQLFQQALQEGMPVTRAEALQRVTNGGTKLGDVQRVVEGSGGLKPFMAERPGQVEAGGQRMLDTVAPPSANPFGIGSQVGAAAEDTLNGIRGAINRATRPSYDAAGQMLVPQNVHAQQMANPLFAETLDGIRNNPALNSLVRGQSDRSVAVYDAVMKELQQRSRNASNPAQPYHNQQVSSVTGQLADDVRGTAVAASGGQTGPYATALAEQARLRQTYLEPRQQGPLGKLAGDPTTEKAIEILFPRNPIPQSAAAVEEAVRAVAARNTPAARELVAAHMESVFNQATRDLQGGANQWGGAGFAAAVRGNRQQAENLEAAFRGLPNGGQTWAGVDRFLNIMEAQGMRQRPNSATAFNQEIQSELRKGGPVGEAITTVAGAGLTWPGRAKEAFQSWRLGANVDQLVNLFTNPQAGRLFRDMVGASDRQAEILAMRLSLMGANQSTQERK